MPLHDDRWRQEAEDFSEEEAKEALEDLGFDVVDGSLGEDLGLELAFREQFPTHPWAVQSVKRYPQPFRDGSQVTRMTLHTGTREDCLLWLLEADPHGV